MRVLIAYDPETTDPMPIADLRRAGFPSHCEVLVLCVADVLLPPASPDVAAEPPPHIQTAIDTARRFATDACARLRAAFPTWTISSDVVADAPAWGIIRVAQQWRADVIVVGARRQSTLSRLALGSVSQKVLHEAPCTVRIVKNGVDHRTRPPRLLIGIDGSPGAEAAVTAVAARQWPKGTTAHLLCVIDPTADSDSSPMGREAGARARLEQLAQPLVGCGLIPVINVLTGDAKSVLLNEAKLHHADCVFVGARGLSAIERILLGSVSVTLAARAPCSVEVVRVRR